MTTHTVELDDGKIVTVYSEEVLVAGDRVRVARSGQTKAYLATRLKAMDWELVSSTSIYYFVEAFGCVWGYPQTGTAATKSADGETWVSVTSDHSNATLLSLCLHGTRLFMGEPANIYYSDNGTAWTLSKALGANHAPYAMVSYGGKVYAFVVDGGNLWTEVWSSTDGTSWNLEANIAGAYILSVKMVGSAIYGIGYNTSAPFHSIIVYSPDGTTWTKTDNSDTGYRGAGLFETNDILYYVTSDFSTTTRVYSYIDSVSTLVYTFTGTYYPATYSNYNNALILNPGDYVFMTLYTGSASRVWACYKDPTTFGISYIGSTTIRGLGELSTNSKIFASTSAGIYRKQY